MDCRWTISLRSYIAFTALFCLVTVTAFGQVSPTGIDPFGTYQRNHIQTIDLFNLNNHIEIPIFTKTARDLTFAGRFVWDLSDAFEAYPCINQGNPTTCWTTSPLQAVQTGTANYVEHTVAGSQTCQPADPQDATIFSFDSIIDEVNTLHQIIGNGGTFGGQVEVGLGCNAGTTTFSTNDSWLIKISYTNQNCFSFGCITSVTEIDPQGNVHNSGNAIVTNPNGNSLVNTSNGTTDSTGNVVWSSPSGGAYTYPAPGGGTESVQVNYSPFTLQNTFGICSLSGSTSLPTSISLPDGSSYSFVYESSTGTYPSSTVTGRIHSITVPAGGTYTYIYSGGVNGNNCFPLNLTIAGSDGSNWTYSRTPCSSNCGTGVNSTTVMTDPACNDTVYNFDSNGLQMQAQTYQGTAGTVYCSSSTKTLLQTVVSCYNGSFTNCGTQATTGTCPNNQLVCRADRYTYLPGLTQPALSEVLYNSANYSTQDNEFDFGVNTGGAPTATPLRATKTTYANIGSNILGRPACVEITAGTSPSTCGTVLGTTNSITKYLSYDSHGNVGSVQQWVSGSTYLSRSFTYSHGLVATMTDVNTAVTTYTNNACSNSYPSSIAEPLSLSRTLNWDCNGGVLTSVIDENSQTTSYANNDPFWRLTQVTDPLGNTTTNTYTPNTEESVLAFISPASSTSTVDTLTTFDGLGRPIISQKRQKPAPATNFDTVSTSYDSNGRVASVSIPCVKTAGLPCPTTPATTTTYDGLSRPQLVTDAGGGTTTYSYSMNDVSVTIGPTPTSQRQMEYDGLGRLTSVCEVTANTLWPGGNCAQKAPVTGYWTKYSYDALGDLTGISENAQGSTIQTRSYVYDGLSRLTSESNPEWNSATASYTYDSISSGTCSGTYNGDLIKKVDPAGNITCSAFDQLHRATNITYPSGPNSAATPSKAFVYDSATVNGQAMLLAKGRLAEAYTGATGSTITDLGFSYDADGRTIGFYESTPHSSGYYDVTASYWANGTLDALTGVSLPTITYGPDGEGRPNSVSASTGGNPVPTSTPTIYNAAGQVTDVTFGSTDPVHFAYDSMGRMTQYELTIDGTATHGDPAWNPNGTLGSLAITDPFHPQSCTYGYDDMARLASVNCLQGTTSVWNQTFTYDPFGNITKSGTISWQPGYTESTNQYLTSANCATTGAAPCYDPDGNLLKDGTDHVYTWDADGHPVTLDSLNLTYDALGRQVELQNGAANTEFMYGPTGKLALMNGQTQTKAFVPLPGGTQVKYAGSAISTYRLPDWLGSLRVGSNPNRTYSWGVAFAPFGEMYAQSGVPAWSFTGEEGTADTVSDEYDFMARRIHSAQGRWISPDPAGLNATDPTTPQSWNRYAYAINNPLLFIDPFGLDYTQIFSDGCIVHWVTFRDETVVKGVFTFSTDEEGSAFCGSAPEFSPRVSQNNAQLATVSAAQAPWYRNRCVTAALVKGAVSAGIDAIGVIPGGGAVSAELSLFRGAAAVSNGTAILGRVQLGVGIITTANGASNTSQLGAAQTALGVGGIVASVAKAAPVVGQVLSGISVGLDFIGTGMDIAKCY